MTEEEKKAIDKLKSWKSYMEKDEDEMEVIDTISNLIEKLQKENEQLNNRDTSMLSEIGRLRTKNNHLENEIKYYYIPKDKIRKRLQKEYDLYNSKEQTKYSQDIIDVLEELLEEE